MPDTKTYSLNDLGVTADDLILLDAAGYGLEETDNISEEVREEILNRLYDLKHKDNTPVQAPAIDYSDRIKAADPATAKQLKYDLANGEKLDLNDVASIVKSEQLVSKELRAEMKRVIVEAANADHLPKEDIAALGYLLDEINGKHADERKNAHSVHEYRKQFDDNPEVLNVAARKLEASATSYNREELETLLRQGEIYLKKTEELVDKPTDADRKNHQTMFAEHTKDMSALIKGYAEGYINIEPDALKAMEKIVDIYGKEYQTGMGTNPGRSYDITQDACNAHQRLAAERRAQKEKGEKAVEKETPVAEVVEDNGPSKEEIDAAKKKKPADRSLRDWIVLKQDIENNPRKSDGQKAYDLKSLTDQARTHIMQNKRAKDLTAEDLKNADAFMKAFGYDIDKKGRAATNPVAMRWKEAVDKRIAEEKGKDKDQIVVVPPVHHVTNDKNIHEWKEPAKEPEKKKGLVGLFNKAKDWTKRNWKKLAIGGAILAASLFGAKQCNGNQGQDDNKAKDKIEVVTPTPTPQPQEKDTINIQDDLAMLHQYAKRIAHQDGLSSEDATYRAVADLKQFSTVDSKIKDRLPGKNDCEKLAFLAMARGNNPKLKYDVDRIIDGMVDNVATIVKVAREAEKFSRNGDKMGYVNDADFTKETGTQSRYVDQGKLAEQVKQMRDNYSK